MDFFRTFWTWLNGELASYVGENTARVASILEPAVVTLGTVYVMIWGYLQLTGRIEEPLIAGVKRIIMLALVFGVGLHLWLYNTLLVDTFYDAPTEFAAAVVGASDPVQTIDTIWNAGGAVADQLFRDGSGFNASYIGYMFAGVVVWLLVGLLCIYTMFLLALSSVALSVLLALGPLFVVFLLFETTRRFFEAWLAQLANYALITILTVMVDVLMLHLVQTYAQQTEALGTAIRTVDAINMLLATVLVFLFLRQVMPIAAGLAGGVALNSLGALGVASRALGAPMKAAMAGVAVAARVANRARGAKQKAAAANAAGPSGGVS
ncbi:MAG TPA: type IV secretion system protein [Steroidobacteraceae bacterium]|nr:type IV secretion system protein [Steroidobacteraceae bacterium]